MNTRPVRDLVCEMTHFNYIQVGDVFADKAEPHTLLMKTEEVVSETHTFNAIALETGEWFYMQDPPGNDANPAEECFLYYPEAVAFRDKREASCFKDDRLWT